MDVSANKKQKTSSHDDIMTQRLKNRERQRRYRERKRLEDDRKMASSANQFAPLQVEVPVIVAPQHCAVPMNVALRDSAMPVNVAPQEYVMSVNVPPQQFVMPVNVASHECVMPETSASQHAVTRVYCGRDWKRDARNPHVLKQKEASSNGLLTPELTSSSGSLKPSLPHNDQIDIAVSNGMSLHVTASESNGTQKLIPCRRNWKAEARNKKGL